jgi:hypothetical protein
VAKETVKFIVKPTTEKHMYAIIIYRYLDGEWQEMHSQYRTGYHSSKRYARKWLRNWAKPCSKVYTETMVFDIK